LSFRWQILPGDPKAGARYTKVTPIELPQARSARIEFTTPKAEGACRLLVCVRDGRGNVASANIPFFVQAGGGSVEHSRP
jgi:hypothetical protein